MLETYSGATKIVPILGHPIAQVKSPIGMTKAFAQRGVDAIVVPFDVPPLAIGAFLNALDSVKNLAGILATVPHKFALSTHADVRSERARCSGSANIMRRGADGRWVADMLDGLGFVRAIHRAGGTIAGRKALLVGAGGAGGAIAYELLKAGAARVAIHDVDAGRRDNLLSKLLKTHPGRVEIGSASPRGYDTVVNATPLGLHAFDPAPVNLTELEGSMFVGDVVTAPEHTPLMRAAEAAGCSKCSGHDMFDESLDLMLNFFLEDGASLDE